MEDLSNKCSLCGKKVPRYNSQRVFTLTSQSCIVSPDRRDRINTDSHLMPDGECQGNPGTYQYLPGLPRGLDPALPYVSFKQFVYNLAWQKFSRILHKAEEMRVTLAKQSS